MSECLNVMLKFYQDNDRMMGDIERINDSYLEMLDALEVLEAENAKLREVVSDGEESARLILDESRALQAENAKLRKLIKDLHEDMWALGEWLEPYEQRMRELGIEVG